MADHRVTEQQPDPFALRAILGSFATGVTIVTTLDRSGQPIGVTANSFSSVSLCPPLVSWCLRNNSYSLPAFRGLGRFAINILNADHAELCRRFARPSADKWKGIAFVVGAAGCPLFDDAVATIECRLYADHVAGDHTILIGEIERASARHSPVPLVFYRGEYRRLQSEGASHGQ